MIMDTEIDNEIHSIHKVWNTFAHDLLNFTTKQPIATRLNPQELPLEALYNVTKHNSTLV